MRSHLDDAALARMLVAREPRAAEEAWRRFAPVVRQILRWRFAALRDVDDLTQEVFLQFFNRVSTLRNPHALRTFVRGICVRVAHWQLRRGARRALSLTATGQLPDLVAPESDPAERATLRRYGEVIDRLSDRLRPLYISRHIDGLELEEVAAAHKVSLSTTRRRLQRAETLVNAVMTADPLLADWAPAQSGRRRRRARPASIPRIFPSSSG